MQAGGGAGALPEPTEAELEELYRSVDFHPEEQQAAAAAVARAGAAGLHLTLDCLVSGASLLLLEALPAAEPSGELDKQQSRGQGAAPPPQQPQEQRQRRSGSEGGLFGGERAQGRGGGIATVELERLKLSAEVHPEKTTAMLTVAEAALHDLCSEPGLSSQILHRGSPGSPASAAATDGYLPPLLKLHFVAPAAGSSVGHAAASEPSLVARGGLEPRSQLDVLVQPLLLRLRPLCIQRIVALVPPVAQVRGRSAGTGWNLLGLPAPAHPAGPPRQRTMHQSPCTARHVAAAAIPSCPQGSFQGARLAALNALSAEARCCIKARHIASLGPPLNLLVKASACPSRLELGTSLASAHSSQLEQRGEQTQWRPSLLVCALSRAGCTVRQKQVGARCRTLQPVCSSCCLWLL